MPINKIGDCGYQSPCRECPYDIGDEIKCIGKGKGLLRPECENCRLRLNLVKKMDEDPLPVVMDTDFISTELNPVTHKRPVQS